MKCLVPLSFLAAIGAAACIEEGDDSESANPVAVDLAALPELAEQDTERSTLHEPGSGDALLDEEQVFYDPGEAMWYAPPGASCDAAGVVYQCGLGTTCMQIPQVPPNCAHAPCNTYRCCHGYVYGPYYPWTQSNQGYVCLKSASCAAFPQNYHPGDDLECGTGDDRTCGPASDGRNAGRDGTCFNADDVFLSCSPSC